MAVSHDTRRRIGARDVATALVVGGDATSRRFIELALERSGAFVVESARDGATALEVLRATVVDLVVADTELADGSGLAFHRRLCQESRLRRVPFVFLSADGDVAAKVAALRAGVEDYVVKPCDAVEIAARAEAIVARHRRARTERRARSHSLAGDFSAMAFPEIVGIVEMGRRSGVLAVVTAEGSGAVHFDEGRIVHVTFGNIVGEPAFQEMFAATAGHFELTPGACAVPIEERTIDASVTALVMEAARVLDDTARNSGPLDVLSFHAVAAISSGDRVTLPPRSTGARRHASLAPDRRTAANFEAAIADPFVLGELRAWTHDELARWTARDVGGDRLEVVLVAETSAGVSAILSVGGAPSERWVLDSLRADAKSFGVTFFLRHERALDVVLVDARDAASILPALRRTPSVAIVAPADGDLLSLGAAARVSLSTFLETLAPPVVVGVGTSTLAASLAREAPFATARSTLRARSGVLGEGVELRELIAEGVRAWGARASSREGEEG